MKLFKAIPFLLALFLVSCSRYYYAPNKANIPSLREKNDMRIEGGIGGGLVMEGADLQTSYAIGKHLGIMVNGSYTQTQYDEYDHPEDGKTKSAFYEAGIGYFKEIEADTRWLFEVYGGMGRGNYFVQDNSIKIPRIALNRYFAQPSLTFTHPIRNIEFGIGSRMSVVDYVYIPYLPLNANLNNELDELIRRPTKFLWEPSFRFSGGFDLVKFYVSYTPSISRSSFEYRDPMIVSLGVRLTFNTTPKRQF